MKTTTTKLPHTHIPKAWKRNCQRINLIFLLSSFLKEVIWGRVKGPFRQSPYALYICNIPGNWSARKIWASIRFHLSSFNYTDTCCVSPRKQISVENWNIWRVFLDILILRSLTGSGNFQLIPIFTLQHYTFAQFYRYNLASYNF